MKNIALLSLGVLALASCGSVGTSQPTNTQPVNPVGAQPQLLGALEVDVSLGGRNPTATATFKPLAGLKGQALLTASSIGFTRGPINIAEDGAQNLRTASVGFFLTNNSTAAVNNLQFVAYSDPLNVTNPSRGGTALNNIRSAAETELTDPAVAQAMKPTNALTDVGDGINIVNSKTVDLQVLSEVETAALQDQVNTATSGAFLTSDPVLGSRFLLPYGFVARSRDGGRFINVGNAPECTSNPNCNKGLVTFAYRFPVTQPSGTTTPYSYSLRFFIFSEFETRITQGDRETRTAFDNRFAAINTVLSPATIKERVELNGAGSTYTLLSNLSNPTPTSQDLGKIRIAGPSTAPLATLLP